MANFCGAMQICPASRKGPGGGTPNPTVFSSQSLSGTYSETPETALQFSHEAYRYHGHVMLLKRVFLLEKTCKNRRLMLPWQNT